MEWESQSPKNTTRGRQSDGCRQKAHMTTSKDPTTMGAGYHREGDHVIGGDPVPRYAGDEREGGVTCVYSFPPPMPVS